MKRDKTSYREAANRLKARRMARGIPVPVMADRLGVSAARYRTWEKLFGPLPQRQYGAAIDRILDDGAPCHPGDIPHIEQPPDYAGLGARVRARREQLGLSRSFVAGEIGLSHVRLHQWEKSLPRKHRGEIETALEDALEVPRGWLRSPIADLPPLRMPRLSDIGCLTVEDEILAVAAWLSRAPASKRVWQMDELTEPEKRRAVMFAARYGASSEMETGLQAIGDHFALTRERVRQIVDVMTDRARGVNFDLPMLARTKDAVSAHSMWRVQDFELAHRDILGCVSLPDADRFAREILGFGIATISDRSFTQNANPLCPVIVSPAFQELMVAVRASAMKMNRSCGAAHIMYVTGLTSEILGKPVSHSDVRSALLSIEGMQWLTEDEDWFWLGPDAANNRVLEAVRKVLAVASCRVDVEDLHRAVCRSRRAYYKRERRAHPPEIEVTQEVLREMLSRVPWLSVIQMNDFVLAEDVAIEDVLNSSELAVVMAIKEHGGAATRGLFNKRFVETGRFTTANLQLVLASSPVIQQIGYGIYGLMGSKLLDHACETAIAPENEQLEIDI